MSEPEITYDLSLLERSLSKWRASAALRAVYGDLFSEMRSACVVGRSLEIGSGIGVAKEFFPELTTSDLVATRFVQCAVSAYDIPRESWSNVVALDVLHHLQRPLDFFASAAAALRPGGRVVLMEPAGTWGGCRLYGMFHHEPCHPERLQSPFQFPADADGGFANMGMGKALFADHREVIESRLAAMGLRVVAVRYRDVFAYLTTGGFSKPAMLPAGLVRAFLAVERCLPQAILSRVGLRMAIVLEKVADR
jgi:SAM-dependent methyltransferase